MAAPQLADLVLETSNAPGTGPIVLGGAPDGRQTFADAFPAGGEVYYYASDGQQTEWGVGTLTVGSPNTLARTTVLGNLFGTKTVLNFTQNITVWCEIPAVKSPALDDAGYLPLKNSPDFTQDVALGAKDADARYAKISDPLVRSFRYNENDYLIDKIGVVQADSRMWFHYIDKDGKEFYPETALRSDLDAKPNLVGENKFSGGQQVINGDNQANPFLIATTKGQGFEFGLGQDVSFIDFHSVTAGNGADFDSRIIASGDNTNGGARLNFETNSLTWGNSPIALQSQLPFSDTGLKIQVFTIEISGLPYINFQTAFRANTVPQVLLSISGNLGGTNGQAFMMRDNVTNAGFQLEGIEWNGGGWQNSNSRRQITVLAIGVY